MSQLGRDAEALAPFFAARHRELQAETAKTAQQLLLWTQPKNGWERKILCSTISPSRPFRRAMPPVSIPSSRAIRTKARSGRRSAPRPTTCTSSRTTCYCAVTFLDGEFKETDVELEAWKTVKGTYPDTPHVKFRTLPAVMVASCIFRGPYSGIGEVYAALAAWIEANGYEYDGPMFNIYHVSPHGTRTPNLRHRSLLPGTEEVSARLYKKTPPQKGAA